jgi:hypothetical protein
MTPCFSDRIVFCEFCANKALDLILTNYEGLFEPEEFAVYDV